MLTDPGHFVTYDGVGRYVGVSVDVWITLGGESIVIPGGAKVPGLCGWLQRVCAAAQREVDAERESCAQIAADFSTAGSGRPPGVRIAERIRARGEVET